MRIRINEEQKKRLDDHFTKTGVRASEAVKRAILAAPAPPEGQTFGPYEIMFNLVLDETAEAKLKHLTGHDLKAAEVVKRLIEKLEV